MTMCGKITEEEALKKDPLLRYTHPTDVLKGLVRLIHTVGPTKFLKGAGYNKQRDALFGCMFALAMRSYQKREFFIQQVNDPPDFVLVAPTNRATIEKPFDKFNIEVVTVPVCADQVTDKLEYVKEIIKKTKIEKAYAQGTILLIFIKAACGEELITPLQKWIKENTQSFSRFGEIMLMYIIKASPKEAFIYKVISLSTNWCYRFSLMEEFKKKLIGHPLINKYGVRVEHKIIK